MTKLSAVFCKKHLAHMSGWRKKLFRVLKFIFGPLGRHFFQTSVIFRDLRILVHSFLYKEQILYPQILKNSSPSLFVPDLLLSWLQASTGVFQNLLIRKSRRTPRKAPGVEFIIQFLEEKLKKSLPNFFCGSVIPMKNTFCKKNGQKRPI